MVLTDETISLYVGAGVALLFALIILVVSRQGWLNATPTSKASPGAGAGTGNGVLRLLLAISFVGIAAFCFYYASTGKVGKKPEPVRDVTSLTNLQQIGSPKSTIQVDGPINLEQKASLKVDEKTVLSTLASAAAHRRRSAADNVFLSNINQIDNKTRTAITDKIVSLPYLESIGSSTNAQLQINSAVKFIGEVAGLNFTINDITISETELAYLHDITPGTAKLNKAVILDANRDIAGLNIVTAEDFKGTTKVETDNSVSMATTEFVQNAISSLNGTTTSSTTGVAARVSSLEAAFNASTGITVGEAALLEEELEYLDNITVGTASGSKAVVLDTSKNIVGLGNVTSDGTITANVFSAGTLTSCTGLPISTGVSGLANDVATFLGTSTSSNLIAAVTDETGSGALVFGTSPTLTTPDIGTPSAGTLTSCTGLPISTGVSGLANDVATFLGTSTSSNLIAAVTDETGSGALVFGTSPTLTTPDIGTPSAGTLTSCTGLPISTGVSGLANDVATFLGTSTSSNLIAAVTDETGSGALVFGTSPTLTTPDIGTPSAGTLTSCTGLPISTGVSGLAAGVATFLGTSTSSNLIAAVTDETGSGALVFGTSPTLTTPDIGTPSAGTLTSCTGLPISTGVSGLANDVATFLGTSTSSNLIAAVTDETGSGALVFGTSPTFAGTVTIDGSFTQAVHTFTATATITKADHAGRILFLGEVGGDANVVLTLPDATGSGNVYEFIVTVVMASTSHTYKIQCPDAANTITGQIQYLDEDSTATTAYSTVAASDTITLGSLQGGLVGDTLTLIDIAADKWMVKGLMRVVAGADPATPFTAAVS